MCSDGTIVENKYQLDKSALPDNLLKWIKQNITDKFTKASYSRSLNIKSSTLGPHTDRSRAFVLEYLLHSGGHQHKTVFYRHKNKNIVLTRPMFLNYDEVIEICSIVVPQHTWTLQNSQIIHSVENIPDIRHGIYLGFEENPFI